MIWATVFACVVSTLFLERNDARQLPDIIWDSSNPVFRIDNTDHVFEVEIKDSLNLVCPLYSDATLEDDTEQSIIYRVSKYGYENCALDDAKPIGQCRNPYQLTSIKHLILEFTPSPSGLEYTPGQSYYFISTSDGTRAGVMQRSVGLCRHKNMRFRIFVRPTLNSLTTTAGKLPETLTNFNPRWRGKLEKLGNGKTPAPSKSPVTTTPPNLDKFLQKMNWTPRTRDLSWWSPGSSPTADGRARNRVSPYSIDLSQEDGISKTRYWPMSDEHTEAGQPQHPQGLVLYEINENPTASSAPSSAGWTLFLSCLAQLLCCVVLRLRWR